MKIRTLAGSVALVTGANRGIGAALVDALIGAGVSRIYAGMRTPVSHRSPAVVPIALDITDEARIQRLASELTDVEILINNAGVSRATPVLAAAAAAEEEMRVNYFGTAAMSRAFAPVLARNGGGAIVNILSILARVNLPQVGSYSASKAAAWSLTQALRAQLASQGTLVVGVLPAFVDTDMASRITLPKLAPTELAASVIEALRTGTEDVYPGDAARILAALRSDEKAVERQFASMFARRPT